MHSFLYKKNRYLFFISLVLEGKLISQNRFRARSQMERDLRSLVTSEGEKHQLAAEMGVDAVRYFYVQIMDMIVLTPVVL